MAFLCQFCVKTPLPNVYFFKHGFDPPCRISKEVQPLHGKPSFNVSFVFPLSPVYSAHDHDHHDHHDHYDHEDNDDRGDHEEVGGCTQVLWRLF